MRWIGQNIYDKISKFKNTVEFSDTVDFSDTVNFSKDVKFYQPVNNADPKVSIGSSDDERMMFTCLYQGTGSQTAQINSFRSFTESSTAHDGRFEFNVDETHILKIQDGGIDFYAGKGIGINGVDILTDNGSGTATLSNIDALDATTISTLNAALTAGDITSVVAGTGLSGGGTEGAVTLNVEASQTGITRIGTLDSLTVDNISINGDTITASGDLEIIATGNDIAVDTDHFDITSSSSPKPILRLTTTGSNKDQSSELRFIKDAADTEDGENLGQITFYGEDEGNNLTQFSKIVGEISESDEGDEAGKLTLFVAESDSTTTAQSPGLIIEGEHATDGQVDVTIANGSASTTIIAGTLTMGSTATINNSGVWVGGVIPSAKLDADTAHLSGTQSFTGTKTFDETISGAIDGNAATATTLATTRAIGGVNFNGSAAIDLPGVNAAGNQSTSGLAATATLAADATTLATPRAINGVDFDGSAAITIPTNRVYGTYIKLLPNDFLPNEDGGTSKGVHLDDTAPTGLKPGIAAMELVAIQDIPEGFKATHVDIYASTNLVIQAYEMDIDASGITSRSSAGNANTTLDITDVAATDSNFLAIIVTTTATSNRVWGGRITIAPQ